MFVKRSINLDGKKFILKNTLNIICKKDFFSPHSPSVRKSKNNGILPTYRTWLAWIHWKTESTNLHKGSAPWIRGFANSWTLLQKIITFYRFFRWISSVQLFSEKSLGCLGCLGWKKSWLWGILVKQPPPNNKIQTTYSLALTWSLIISMKFSFICTRFSRERWWRRTLLNSSLNCAIFSLISIASAPKSVNNLTNKDIVQIIITITQWSQIDCTMNTARKPVGVRQFHGNLNLKISIKNYRGQKFIYSTSYQKKWIFLRKNQYNYMAGRTKLNESFAKFQT